MVNGVDNPLLSVDAARDPLQQAWYAGRVYAPSVTLAPDGCSATMLFAGYATPTITKKSPDHRQMGVVTIAHPCPGPAGAMDMSAAAPDMARAADLAGAVSRRTAARPSSTAVTKPATRTWPSPVPIFRRAARRRESHHVLRSPSFSSSPSAPRS